MEHCGGENEKIIQYSGTCRGFGHRRRRFGSAACNPWEISPNDGTFDNVDYATSTEDAVTQAPIYGNGPTDGEVLPVDPWAKARDKSGIETWRGSGQHRAA